MTFRIGQKVVCVRHHKNEHTESFIRPEIGGVYTVSGDTLAYGEQYLFLKEIKNAPVKWRDLGTSELPFWCGQFRPLVERKTDISVFTALLNPANHNEFVE